MKEVEYLVGIYHFLDPKIDGLGKSYYLLYLFDEKGFLDHQTAKEAYREFCGNETLSDNARHIGPFESVEQLDKYSFLLCEKLNAAKISLLSVEEYNGLLEKATELQGLMNDLLDKGNVIQNIDRKKKGFFAQFFN